MQSHHPPPNQHTEAYELYLGWRSACLRVHAAYCGWVAPGANGHDRARAYDAYVTALDREECAAATYGAALTAALG